MQPRWKLAGISADLVFHVSESELLQKVAGCKQKFDKGEGSTAMTGRIRNRYGEENGRSVDVLSCRCCLTLLCISVLKSRITQVDFWR